MAYGPRSRSPWDDNEGGWVFPRELFEERMPESERLSRSEFRRRTMGEPAIDEVQYLQDEISRLREAISSRDRENIDLREILSGRISSNDMSARLARHGSDLIYALNRHAERSRHHGPGGDPEPQALIWIIEKLDFLEHKISNLFEQHVKNEKKQDNTDDVLSELKKLVDE